VKRPELIPPQLSTLPAVDWETFFLVLKEAVDLEIQMQQWPDGDVPIFVESYPKDRNGKSDTSFHVITWSVVKSVPAATDNSGTRRPIGVREIMTRPSTTKTGYFDVQAGWKEETTIRFTIWSKDNGRANQLVLWFHKLIYRFHYLQFFKARGIDYFLYLGRGPDTKSQDAGQELNLRTLDYVIRLPFLERWESKALETATFSASTPTETGIQRIDVRSDGQ
jgi:hypothetical protein